MSSIRQESPARHPSSVVPQGASAQHTSQHASQHAQSGGRCVGMPLRGSWGPRRARDSCVKIVRAYRKCRSSRCVKSISQAARANMMDVNAALCWPLQPAADEHDPVFLISCSRCGVAANNAVCNLAEVGMGSERDRKRRPHLAQGTGQQQPGSGQRAVGSGQQQ